VKLSHWLCCEDCGNALIRLISAIATQSQQ
jgi:hypothetical protein